MSETGSQAPQSTRRCPVCDRWTSLEFCPEDRAPTIEMALAKSAREPELGSTVAGRYIIDQKIGRGGFSAVFAARQASTGQKVALKILSEGLERDEVSLKRFLREARVTSGLKHTNTVRVFDFGQDQNGLLYIAMELLDGNTLKAELRTRIGQNRTFSERETLELCIAISRSLSEAHAAGIIHRDLKPENIFLHRISEDETVVKVLDFGVVKLVDFSGTIGDVGSVSGTPTFMSPEQISSPEEVDARSDLYSVGIMIYNLLAGAPPFGGPDVMNVLFAHVNAPVPDIQERVATPISAPTVELMHALLAKRPSDRPSSAKELRQRLEFCLSALGGPDRTGSWANTPSSDIRVPPEMAQAPEHPTAPMSANAILQQQSIPSSSERLLQDPRAHARRREMILATAIAGLLLAIGAGVYLQLGGSRPDVQPLTQATPPPPPVAAPTHAQQIEAVLRDRGLGKEDVAAFADQPSVRAWLALSPEDREKVSEQNVAEVVAVLRTAALSPQVVRTELDRLDGRVAAIRKAPGGAELEKRYLELYQRAGQAQSPAELQTLLQDVHAFQAALERLAH